MSTLFEQTILRILELGFTSPSNINSTKKTFINDINQQIELEHIETLDNVLIVAFNDNTRLYLRSISDVNEIESVVNELCNHVKCIL